MYARQTSVPNMTAICRKKAKIEEQEIIAKNREKEAGFLKAKARFFGLLFTDGQITVRVLESVAEIILEGKAMHHCVGSYHSKADSLDTFGNGGRQENRNRRGFHIPTARNSMPWSL